MRAIELKRKYPEIWDEVYENIVNDLCECMTQADIALFKEGNKHCRITRIAHNASFFACDAIRKHTKQKI